MIELKCIEKNFDVVKDKLKKRWFDVSEIDTIYNLLKLRSKLMTDLQNLKFQKNIISKKISIIKTKGENFSDLMKKVALIKSSIKKSEIYEQDVNKKIKNKILYIPNIPLDFVPVGKNEKDNIVIKEYIIGKKEILKFKPHYQIGLDKKIIDFKTAVKLSGSRFWIYKNKGAELVRALSNFMINEHIKRGYVEILPPLIVNENIVQGTGQLPKFKKDLFKIEKRKAYLIPTSEVPLTNLYFDMIIDLSKPKMLTSYTPCFRSEAGSGGKDIKGLIRGHQFYKVEVVKITKKEDLEAEFKKTVEDCKNILEKLQLRYREIMLCTGDLGFSSERTIDLEVWIPSENKYREVSSISSFGTFQSRRSKIRYRDKKGKIQYAHTINGSGIAIDRVIAAILEIYQNKDGSIAIPEVLIPYFKNKTI